MTRPEKAIDHISNAAYNLKRVKRATGVLGDSLIGAAFKDIDKDMMAAKAIIAEILGSNKGKNKERRKYYETAEKLMATRRMFAMSLATHEITVVVPELFNRIKAVNKSRMVKVVDIHDRLNMAICCMCFIGKVYITTKDRIMLMLNKKSSQPEVTWLLRILVKAGLVASTRENDGQKFRQRFPAYYLTEDGEKMVAKFNSIISKHMEPISATPRVETGRVSPRVNKGRKDDARINNNIVAHVKEYEEYNRESRVIDKELNAYVKKASRVRPHEAG